MRLVHTTRSLNKVLRILQEGIKLPEYHHFKNYGDSNPKNIYFSVVKDISLNNKTYGDYNFFLNMDWVRRNNSQFKSKNPSNWEIPAFFKFLKEYGINREQISKYGEDLDFFQIISKKNIPLEGIEYLLIDEKIKQKVHLSIKSKLLKHLGLYIFKE